ncbi:MAG: hypothetical protein ACPG9E_04600 [Poseidonia sp.]
MNARRRLVSLCMVVVLLASVLPLHVQANEHPSVRITTHWVGQGTNDAPHAYLLTFSDNGSYGIEVDMEHTHNGSLLDTSHTVVWGSAEGVRTALLTFNTSLSWGDTIQLTVTITDHDDATDLDIETVRDVVVGLWNQPMEDHEILLSTTWALDQSYATDAGDQNFSLAFSGQGWQERVGDTLSSWELGNGTFATVESTDDGVTELDLVLTQLWKNETIVAGVLTSQVFDAQGFGGLKTTLVDGDTTTVIDADVSHAMLNRSVINGVVGERLSLEATGLLNVSEDDGENNSLNIDGELAVFFFEYADVDGERILQHTQFEAMADFVLIDEETRLDVSLNGFTSVERWEDGVRTQHLEELYGDGTFGFADQDENASVQINGTILDLHTKLENGTTMIDDLHVDGTLTGDVQGTFGVVRGIETTGMQANITGEEFLVNVIFQESWFNITGVNGGNFFDGAGVGATHNQTWDYQAVQSDWENRTVRLVWRETGPDASEGEEFPERSPQQRNATAPVAEENLGDLTVGRETGWMPIPLATDDYLRLNGQDGIILTVRAGDTRVDTRDGHNLTVIDWTGVYGGEGGVATGSVVSAGPLSGLLSTVDRSLTVPFGEENESVVLQETQVLERVLSPEIVSEDDNNPPVVSEIEWREGLAVGEGGSVAHLQATVEDSEWNVVSVLADLSSLGLGTVELNDRGLHGDQAVGDDVYTAAIIVTGLEVGLVDVVVTASDSFGASTVEQGSLEVTNQPPRLIDAEIVPDSLERGQSVVVNIKAYDGHGVASVSIDLRAYGGAVVNLTSEGGDSPWAAMVQMPSGMTPGDQSLLVIAEDGLGATSQQRIYTPAPNGVGDAVFGPHHVRQDVRLPVEVNILNDRPNFTTAPTTVEKDTQNPTTYTVEVNDPDGIERVQIDLGVFTPIGGQTWAFMHDDGVNGGDEVAGDGVYSVVLSIRDGTPLGTHEVSLRAFDTYGELNTASVAITLIEADDPPVVSGGLSTAVLGGLGLVVLLGALVVMTMMWRRGDGGGGDRFGMQ